MSTDKPAQPRPELLKAQKIRKRELRRAMNRLQDRLKLDMGDSRRGIYVYGLRLAITILGEMRKEINGAATTN